MHYHYISLLIHINQKDCNSIYFYYFRILGIFSKNRITFTLISGGLFIFLIVVFHLIYEDFLF